jgi:hypothetical protein
MSQPPEQFENDENPEEGYPVAPLPPGLHEHRPVSALFDQQVNKQVNLEIDRKTKKPFQFSLADMFTLTTAFAVFMSIFSLITRGFAPKTMAGAAGIGAFVSGVFLLLWPPNQPLLRLGWCVLFALYLMACVGAIFWGR